jgi:hypothetical protein
MDPDLNSTSKTTGRIFSDDERRPGSAAEAAARRRWPRVAAILVIAAAAVTAGVFAAGSLTSAPEPSVPAGGVAAPSAPASPAGAPGTAPSAHPSSTQSVAATSPATSPAASPATEATVARPTPGRYASASAGASFALPDGWTVEESAVGTADNPGTRIFVFNEARMQVAELYHGAAGGVGGACGPGPYPMVELDTAPVADSAWAAAAGVRFSYRVLDMRADGGAFDYQIGLVDRERGQLTDSCLMYSFVAGAPQGTLSFANRSAQSAAHDDPIFNSMAEAREYLGTPEYRKLKAMILSLELKE